MADTKETGSSVYLLFEYDQYYPAGGISDCTALIRADNDEDAVRQAREILTAARIRYDFVDLVRIDDHHSRTCRVEVDLEALVRP